ncbi:hypothetical protein BDW22DRAFT_1355084, partial [Trametopsis cervina]
MPYIRASLFSTISRRSKSLLAVLNFDNVRIVSRIRQYGLRRPIVRDTFVRRVVRDSFRLRGCVVWRLRVAELRSLRKCIL